MMKKYVWALGLVIGLMACNSKPKEFVLNGTITGGVKDSTQIFLKKTNAQNQPVDVDTTIVKDGKFTFSGPAAMPEMHYLFIEKTRGYIPVIIEGGDIELTAQKDSLNYAKIEGTVQNELFGNFMEKSKDFAKKAMSINEDMRKAATAKDTATMTSLRDESKELQEEGKNLELDFIKENPNALISALILDRIAGSNALPENEVSKLYDSLTPEIKETKAGKGIADKLKQLKEREEKLKTTKIGAVAPDFSAPTPTGEKLALKDVVAKGKVTMVDFWAAWCKPCRAENPNVVKIYKKYHEKGLNIIGVSLDRKAEDWKKAIADDGLVWDQVSNVKYFDEIAKLYNIEAIPATFLLDSKGVIVAKNLRGQALEDKIAEMLQ